MVKLLAEIEHHVLQNPAVHPHHVVQYLNADDSQRQNRLRQNSSARGLKRWSLECFIVRQQQCRDHLNDAKHFSALEDEENMLTNLDAFLIDGTCACIDGDHCCESL